MHSLSVCHCLTALVTALESAAVLNTDFPTVPVALDHLAPTEKCLCRCDSLQTSYCE